MKECNQCGKCCIKYSNGRLSASDDEIEYWEMFRPEIAKYVSGGNIWVNPDTGQKIELCPWLSKLPHDGRGDKFICDIYHDRPNDCRYYPVNIPEMIADECEMLEQKDFNDHSKAQIDLDKIMADSRPALE